MESAHQTTRQTRLRDLPEEDRRVIRAWCMYDWANSAFATSGVAAIFPVYFVFLFKEALGDSATILGITFTSSSTWSLGVAISTAIVALSSPVLGIISDRVPIKKTLLWIYTAIGSLFTVLAFFSAYTAQPWMWLFGMFILANIGFAGSLVFYNSFLPHLGPARMHDDISSRGFAYGYAGGGLLLLVHLALILATQNTDFADIATRFAIASVGVWWFGWAIWTLRVMPEPHIQRRVFGLTAFSALALGFRELGQTLREIRRYRVVLTYLGAYLLFNDGLQTVLAIAGAFAADTLGIALAFNMATIVIIQFVAVPGALAFSWLADRITTKPALIVSLIAWTVIVLFGVAIVPLSPSDHSDFDFQLAYIPASGDYVIEVAPDLPEEGLELEGRGDTWLLSEGATLKPRAIQNLPDAIRGRRRIRVQPVGPRRRIGRPVRGRRCASVGVGHGTHGLVAVHRQGLPLGTTRTASRLPVASPRSSGGLGNRRKSGARKKSVRSDNAGVPKRRVLLILWIHEQGVFRVRTHDVHRRDRHLRHARRGHLYSPDNHRRYYRADKSECVTGNTSGRPRGA